MKTAKAKKSAAKSRPAPKAASKKGTLPMTEVRAAAKALGIPAFGKKKVELIRAIQAAEGNFNCYGTAASGYCDQAGCRWMADCLEESARPKG